MKIAIIGATGHAGSLLVQEGLKRGQDITAIMRNASKLTVDVPYIEKDLFALTKEDLLPFDVVIDAFRAPAGKEDLHETSLAHLITILSGTKVRLLVVGGSSSLFIDDQGTRMIDQAPTDAPYYPTAYHMYQAFRELPTTTQLRWTYLSPAAFFNPDGAATGEYRFTGDHLGTDAAGNSEISMADYAVAMLDIAEQNLYENQHVGVVGK